MRDENYSLTLGSTTLPQISKRKLGPDGTLPELNNATYVVNEAQNYFDGQVTFLDRDTGIHLGAHSDVTTEELAARNRGL